MDVINAFRRIGQQDGIKGVSIRNDNGSQFIANRVKQYLRSAEANQEFTHVSTPEENAYIEAFHSIVQREVIDRFEFDSFYHAKHTLAAHRLWYDNRRNHRSISTPPKQRWDEHINITFEKRRSALATIIIAEVQTKNNWQTKITVGKLHRGCFMNCVSSVTLNYRHEHSNTRRF